MVFPRWVIIAYEAKRKSLWYAPLLYRELNAVLHTKLETVGCSLPLAALTFKTYGGLPWQIALCTGHAQLSLECGHNIYLILLIWVIVICLILLICLLAPECRWLSCKLKPNLFFRPVSGFFQATVPIILLSTLGNLVICVFPHGCITKHCGCLLQKDNISHIWRLPLISVVRLGVRGPASHSLPLSIQTGLSICYEAKC